MQTSFANEPTPQDGCRVMANAKRCGGGRAGRILKALRQEAGLSSRQMAAALGWSYGRYQNYEDYRRADDLPGHIYVQVMAQLMARGIDERRIRELLNQTVANELDRLHTELREIKTMLASVAREIPMTPDDAPSPPRPPNLRGPRKPTH